MRVSLCSRCLLWVAIAAICFVPLYAQQRNGSIAGNVADPNGGLLPGAQVELQPGGQTVVSNVQGKFTVLNLAPGSYKLKVSYVGFAPYSTDVTVSADQPTHVEAVLQVAMENQTVTVNGGRERGEIEALNIERTADNIVQVLPAEVITSLPNTNIADAIGRLPSVSVERDEGEAKYVQIRGTEPRLSNVTIDDVHVPSPEGTRNVKLDVIPADLIDLVEVNKTLSANQDADAIGGSVNLVTKSAGDRPYLALSGLGGYTPINNGRTLYQISATGGRRFGPQNRFGALVGGSYDYNGRGIDDYEPSPGIFTLPNGKTFSGPNTANAADYLYRRQRYGVAGEADYKLGDGGFVYVRGLFSKFNDLGEDWIYAPSVNNFVSDPKDTADNTCGITSTSGVQGCGGMGFTDVNRRPTQRIISVQAGAVHAVHSFAIAYKVALSQSNYRGGFDVANFNGPGANDNSVAFGIDTTNPFIPKFPVLNGVNIYNPATYTLSGGNVTDNHILERDVMGEISLNKQYSAGSHSSSFEMGLKGWNAKKTNRNDRENFLLSGFPMTKFLGTYTNSNYYGGNLTHGPVTQWQEILAAETPGGFSPNTKYNLQNAFDINERIWAGYAMDTINFGQLRLQAGVRVESTQDTLLANNLVFNSTTNTYVASPTPRTANNSYINAFPSVQAQYKLGGDTILRAAYGVGIARPNFGDLAPYFVDTPGSNPEFAQGNPNLSPTHAQNFDLLAEHYLRPVGILQGGFFYKSLSNPIYSVTVPYLQTNKTVATLTNGPSAHITGVEFAWQQQLQFLPRPLLGFGLRANYSYTTSRATFPTGFGRTDTPTLVRTAPNNYNVDVTYDKRGLSARMGLTHNDAYIWSYGGAGTPDPNGDTYLYPHTQVDAQASYYIPKARRLQVVVSGLNLNNEVFGFYQGAEQFPIQREFYKPTISAGLRWTLSEANSK
jgi:TonB-dependent receptor